jgi:hypothetical protein
VNGDGLQDWYARERAPGDRYHDFFTWIVSRKSLREEQAEAMSDHSQLRLIVPSSPDRAYALLYALSGEQGIPFGPRRIPLDPDPLFMHAVAHPIWGNLDGRGEATILFNDWPLLGDISFAALVFDPKAPMKVRTISNRAVLSSR